jgi:hypothetical protein
MTSCEYTQVVFTWNGAAVQHTLERVTLEASNFQARLVLDVLATLSQHGYLTP